MMSVSDRSRPASPMSTRAEEANKRGLEDVAGASSTENKKKSSLTDEVRIGASPSLQQQNVHKENLSPTTEEDGDLQPVNTKTLNSHVALIMDKLNSIERNPPCPPWLTMTSVSVN